MGKSPVLPKENKIFIDADAFVSIINPDDSNHEKAVTISKYIKSFNIEAVTSNFSIGEAITVTSQDTSLGKALEFGRNIFTGSEVVIIEVDKLVENKALERMSYAKSKNVRFTDYINMVLMDELKIKYIFSFDKHYKQEGYKRLLID